jgi:hypothetical protein
MYIMVNDHREAIYFIRGTDAKGALLEGRNTYTVTFVHFRRWTGPAAGSRR